MNIHRTAFVTLTTLTLATVGCAFAAVKTAGTVATIAYAILATTLFGLYCASLVAYMDPSSKTSSTYFSNLATYAGYGIVATWTFVSISIFRKAIDAIGKMMEEKITGPKKIQVQHTT